MTEGLESALKDLTNTIKNLDAQGPGEVGPGLVPPSEA